MIKQLYRFLNPRFQNLFMEYRINLKPRYGHGSQPHKGLHDIIVSNRDYYKELLVKVNDYKDFLWEIRGSEVETDTAKPAWNNEFLPGLDMISIYLILSEFKPRRYIEIGSGNSTRVAFKAVKDQGLDTEIISIDPDPRVEIAALADTNIREPLETISADIPGMLNENDVLFIDGSHRIMPNSDCTVFFLEILPNLRKGVIVQIHDIYLPYDYPQFMCDRFYSEQYGLAMYLLADQNRFDIILPNYFISEDPGLAISIASFWEHENLHNVEKHGCSFWFRIR